MLHLLSYSCVVTYYIDLCFVFSIMYQNNNFNWLVNSFLAMYMDV